MSIKARPLRATECALKRRERLAILNDTWRDNGTAELWTKRVLQEIGARVGIHTGLVVAGNLGSPTRMKYGVIGDNVNVAARLEALNKTLNTNLLISGEVFATLPDTLKQEAVDHGEHQVKGRDQHVRAFAI